MGDNILLSRAIFIFQFIYTSASVLEGIPAMSVRPIYRKIILRSVHLNINGSMIRRTRHSYVNDILGSGIIFTDAGEQKFGSHSSRLVSVKTGGRWEGIGDVRNIPTQLLRGLLFYFSRGFNPARPGTTCLARDQGVPSDSQCFRKLLDDLSRMSLIRLDPLALKASSFGKM